ncbi:hypothetical protein OKA04_12145 [Luteolibacter flavescens]|uniref:DUF3592 domain-containing protein n=1 Tax=Luteolibacter flavescens TaxID=1859460 RepID=A0ABT3FPI2_9BACT|nr:hypothetical protein [Luteolibacter flavescens]MCW1885481.1 hypothetical protein [Luteolibacter flavescens]
MRPVCRWKSFWFGVLILAFLAFAWCRSMNHRDTLVGHYGPWEGGILSGSGALKYVGEFDRENERDLYFFTITARLPSEDGQVFAKAWSLEEFGPSIGYWFLMLLFAIPWGAFLAWRFRRQRALGNS